MYKTHTHTFITHTQTHTDTDTDRHTHTHTHTHRLQPALQPLQPDTSQLQPQMLQNKYKGMRVAELKKALEGRGLRKSGNKPELIRVRNNIHQNPET